MLYLFLFQNPLPCRDKGRKYKLHLEQDIDAGIRLMVLYFHCLTWHRGTRVTFLISGKWQMQGRVFSVAGRCLPTPMTRAHIPVLAPHSLELDDRALLTADCYEPWLGADTPTQSTPSWAVHSMAEGAKAERGREWSLGCSVLPVSRLASSQPWGLQTKGSSPTGPGLSLATRG